VLGRACGGGVDEQLLRCSFIASTLDSHNPLHRAARLPDYRPLPGTSAHTAFERGAHTSRVGTVLRRPSTAPPPTAAFTAAIVHMGWRKAKKRGGAENVDGGDKGGAHGGGAKAPRHKSPAKHASYDKTERAELTNAAYEEYYKPLVPEVHPPHRVPNCYHPSLSLAALSLSSQSIAPSPHVTERGMPLSQCTARCDWIRGELIWWFVSLSPCTHRRPGSAEALRAGRWRLGFIQRR
jgi:hypothetical protein